MISVTVLAELALPTFKEPYEALLNTIVHFHQLPVWNPYKCGGMPMLGNPQSHFLTPWFLLTLLFGPFIGLRLEIPIYIAIAWSGAYVLARVAGTRPLGALAAAMLFATSSWFYVRVTAGLLAMCGFAYLPWAIAAC